VPGIYRPRHPERTVLYRVLFHNFDRFLTACKTRGFCPSCHAKRREEWGQWVRETLLLDMPHRQVVLTIPKMTPARRYRRTGYFIGSGRGLRGSISSRMAVL
jgi:hypothetical protein